MSLTLSQIPGFSDLSNASLEAGDIAHSIHLAKIDSNGNFGVARTEIFTGFFTNGQTVPLPTSPIDGYNYSRSELMYAWATGSTFNYATGSISGTDALWFAAWGVNQSTGLVSTFEAYRRSGDHSDPTQSNDGVLFVYVIAQRQNNAIIIATPPTFTDLGSYASDDPFNESLAQALNDNSKFSIVASEVIYMGEFVDGGTVPQPVSLLDGHTYAYANVKFMASWRWTASGSSFAQPDSTVEQLGPMQWSINAGTGAVDITVQYSIDGGENVTTKANHGRISVIAFCDRLSGVTLSPAADDFVEIDSDLFLPGEPLRASTINQMIKNQEQAVCTPEFFGPTDYGDGDTISLPTSPVDGYNYARNEVIYVWEWNDTTPNTGTHLRIASWAAVVDQATGTVDLKIWRVPPGSAFDQTDGFGSIKVVTVGIRQRAASVAIDPTAPPSATGGSPPSTDDPFADGAPRRGDIWRFNLYNDAKWDLAAAPIRCVYCMGGTTTLLNFGGVNQLGTASAPLPHGDNDCTPTDFSAAASGTTVTRIGATQLVNGNGGLVPPNTIHRYSNYWKPTSTSSVRYWLGLAQALALNTAFFASDTPNTIYAAFRYSAGVDSGWQAVAGISNAAFTVVSTGVGFDSTQAHLFEIAVEQSTFYFYIDGILVATISSNTPASTARLAPFWCADNKNLAATTAATHYWMSLSLKCSV